MSDRAVTAEDDKSSAARIRAAVDELNKAVKAAQATGLVVYIEAGTCQVISIRSVSIQRLL